MIKKLIIIVMGTVLLFTGCSNEPQQKKPIVLSVDIWIGASPLYYAEAKGWLKDPNIKVLVAPSITENLKNYTSKACDMVTGTNHEYKILKEKYPNIHPYIIYDRSYGGDVILANRPINELKRSSNIMVYLEKNTVGEEMWDYFSEYEMIDTAKTTLYGRFQEELSIMRSDETTPPKVIITYNPHNLPLLKNGFHEIASSKDERYLIVDAIFMTKEFAMTHKEQIHALHDAMVNAVKVYEQNPKEFYETVKATLGNPTYEEFQTMAGNIDWILPHPSEGMKKRLLTSGYETKELL